MQDAVVVATMDSCYKMFGVRRDQVNNQGDLEKIRIQAKQMWKKHNSRGQKFEASKVLEFFGNIEKDLKNKDRQILGRGRKEREMDSHFNSQTKEIRQIQRSKQKKAMAQMSGQAPKPKEKTYRLPGDRLRIKKKTRSEVLNLTYMEKRAPADNKPKAPAAADPLQALQKISAHLTAPARFSKAVALFATWIKDYLREENKAEVFSVLDTVINDCDITQAEARPHVIAAFKIVLNDHQDWFTCKDSLVLRDFWKMATMTHLSLFTDDQFALAKGIKELTGLLGTFSKEQYDFAHLLICFCSLSGCRRGQR